MFANFSYKKIESHALTAALLLRSSLLVAFQQNKGPRKRRIRRELAIHHLLFNANILGEVHQDVQYCVEKLVLPHQLVLVFLFIFLQPPSVVICGGSAVCDSRRDVRKLFWDLALQSVQKL